MANFDEIINSLEKHRFPKLDENINSNNTMNSMNSNDRIDSIGLLRQDLTNKTKSTSSARPPGPQGVSDIGLGQKACRVSELPKILTQERINLQADGNWFYRDDLDYVKFSIWPALNKSKTNFTSFKVQYGLKTCGNWNLKQQQYKSQLTANHNDYLGYVKQLWQGWESWQYQAIADYVKASNNQVPRQFAYAGRCSPNLGKRTTVNRAPNLPYTSILLGFDRDEDEWFLKLFHHDIEVVRTIPNWEWQQSVADWINQYGIKNEFNKKTPPMLTTEWRRVE